MPLFIRAALARWRFRQITARHDREIAAARKGHRAVAPLLRAKADFVHACLRGAS